jgi:hypothetical protein
LVESPPAIHFPDFGFPGFLLSSPAGFAQFKRRRLHDPAAGRAGAAAWAVGQWGDPAATNAVEISDEAFRGMREFIQFFENGILHAQGQGFHGFKGVLGKKMSVGHTSLLSIFFFQKKRFRKFPQVLPSFFRFFSH